MIDKLLEDVELSYEDVEDVMINGTKIFVFGNDKMFSAGNLTDEEVCGLIRDIKRISGKTSPMIDCTTREGHRINLVVPPISVEPYITVRRFRENPLSILELIEMGMLNESIAGFLWFCMDAMGTNINLLIAGECRSGRTTLLNAILGLLPDDKRVITIEDTLELNLKKESNWVRLKTTDDANLQVLIENSLRMRPDKIVVGEIRGREAIDMVIAMNIGIGVMGTVRANNTKDALAKLHHEPERVPKELIALLDVVVVTRNVGSRVVYEVCEVGKHDKEIELGKLWEFKNDFILKHSPILIRHKISEVSGLSEGEILKEIKKRERMLKNLYRKGIRDYAEVRDMVERYYEKHEIN